MSNASISGILTYVDAEEFEGEEFEEGDIDLQPVVATCDLSARATEAARRQ